MKKLLVATIFLLEVPVVYPQERIISEMHNYGTHDSLTIDRTDGSPALYRKNIYIPLDIED